MSADPAQVPIEYFLHERYAARRRRSRALDTYYSVKPRLPRAVQLAARRAYARVQIKRRFPAWPIETVLVDRYHADLRAQLRRAPHGERPLVNFWPDGREFAFVLTHDVEGPAGIANIPRLLEVERRHAVVSAWNFVAEWYPIPDGTFSMLRDAGCEIGLHGIRHDGKLFQSRANFEAELPRIHAYLRDWEVDGFRSPATGRNADWMHELGCLYDSSFPDTDPFEPQAGGCCSIHPFFFGDVVELPITLTQDHTLFEILRERSIARWVQKSSWIIANHGLINLIVHPDYVVDAQRLALYEKFLEFLGHQPMSWHALPRDVARWWKARAAMKVGSDGRLDGPAFVDGGLRPTVAYAREVDGRVVISAQAGRPR